MTKKAPGNLSRESALLWNRLCKEYAFDDAGFLLLKVALEAYDRLQGARRQIDEEGAVVETPTHFFKEHPCLKIEKQARDGFLSAMRMLNLDIEPSGDIGRPPGS